MSPDATRRFGGYCAMLLAVVAVVGNIIYLLLPADQKLGSKAAQLLPSVAQGAPLLMTQLWILALEGVLGLAVVPALSRVVMQQQEGLVRWLSTLAMLGFAVTAVGNVQTIARLPGIAAAYVAGDAATKAAIVPLWKSSLDLLGLWGYAAVGVWIAVVSYLAWRSRAFPVILSYLGVAYGLLLVLLSLALITASAATLLIPVVVLSTVAAPIWLAWAGLLAIGRVPAR